MKLRSLTVPFAILLVPSLASAHAALTDPMPRSPDDGLTTEPCGDVAAGAPTMLMAGETITVSWGVGQSHGGFLQIDFAEADDVFGDTILATDLPDTEGSPTSAEVTLPDVDCDACTLRLIQINPDESNYVSCADIQLVGGGTGSGSGSSGGSGSGSSDSSGDSGSTTGGPDGTSSGGSDGTTSGTATASTLTAGNETSSSGDGSDTTASDQEDSSSGCGCSSTAGPSPIALGLLGLLALRRRRNRR